MQPKPNYHTKQERIAIAGAAGLTIRSLLDREQFFDPLGEAERLGISSAAWPIFGMLWPSGAQLAARMAARPLHRGERILEIGCGLALPSLVAHRRGSIVTASDCHPLAESFLLENLQLNNLPPLRYLAGQWSTPLLAHSVAYADDVSAIALEPLFTLPLVLGRFDLIIGSDVLYERDESGALASFIAHHTAPAAQVWIVDPNRSNRPAFNQRMAALGFALTEERLDAPASVGAAAYKGRLLVYTDTK